MKVVINDLKKSISNLSNYINLYENNCLNMNNLFSEIHDYWIGDNAISFFNKIDLEQKKVNINIGELKSLLNVYKYIVNEYSNFGNDIMANINQEEYLATYFNVYLNIINQIIILYDNIPSSYTYLIDEQRRYFINLKQQISDIKNNLKAACSDISRIETAISNKFSKIKIEVLKESDISSLL